MESAIVNLDGKFDNNVKAYVMLSRLTTGVEMGIIGDWHIDLFKTEPSPDMLRYLNTYILPKESITLAGLTKILVEIQDLDTALRAGLQRGNTIV